MRKKTDTRYQFVMLYSLLGNNSQHTRIAAIKLFSSFLFPFIITSLFHALLSIQQLSYTFPFSNGENLCLFLHSCLFDQGIHMLYDITGICGIIVDECRKRW